MSVLALPLRVDEGGNHPEHYIHFDVHIILFDDERAILIERDYIPPPVLPLKTGFHPVVNHLIHQFIIICHVLKHGLNRQMSTF